MVLYHGTYKFIEQINLKRGNKRMDFGQGFYLGDNLQCAKDWAADRFPEKGVSPTVMVYEVDDVIFTAETLDLLRFDTPSKEWLEFVELNHRRDLPKSEEPRHSHDMVYGRVANDRAADTIAEFVDGDIPWEEALKQIKTVPDVFQLSLHTPLSLEYIKAIEFWQLLNNEWQCHKCT